MKWQQFRLFSQRIGREIAALAWKKNMWSADGRENTNGYFVRWIVTFQSSWRQQMSVKEKKKLVISCYSFFFLRKLLFDLILFSLNQLESDGEQQDIKQNRERERERKVDVKFLSLTESFSLFRIDKVETNCTIYGRWKCWESAAVQ